MNDVVISKENYDEYIELKRKNTPMKKIRKRNYHCPVCDYVVDQLVPSQKYCDRCGQKLAN